MSSANKHDLLFSDITTKENLLSFLKEQGKKHAAFLHYTDLDTLNKMLEKGKIHLSRADTLNDFLEGGQCADNEMVFIGSFSYGLTENIAMWSMYAFPYNRAVRLRITKNTMLDFVDSFNVSPHIYKTNGEEISYAKKPKLTIANVVYENSCSYFHPASKVGKTLLKSNLVSEKNGNAFQNSVLNWCIKKAIWKSENEVRLILKLGESLSDPSIKKIAIDFSKALHKISVTCGPCVDAKEERNALKKFGKFPVVKSEYYNGTFFKSCNAKCNGTPFCKERKK